jgi:uncharacterized membrane protein HdeD (DUF308 family)
MSPLSSTSIVAPRAQELEALREHWKWFLALGIAMAVLGTIAIGSACLATVTVTVTWLFGFLMLGSGIATIVSAFSVDRWSGTLIHLLMGVLYTIVGFMIIDQPVDSAIQITLIIAVFLIVGGVIRIIFALVERFPGWGWMLLNGAVTLLAGLLIYKQWPLSGLWVIGLFVGIDLILNGWTWIALSLAVRKKSPAQLAAA